MEVINEGETIVQSNTVETPAEAPKVETPVKEDLVTRASKFKVETPKVDINVEEPKFDVNDIEKITDPAAKEIALKAYKSFQRGFNQKFQELAELRKQTEASKQPTAWSPERIKAEMNKPDFIEASKVVLQEQNPPESGMTETEWSSLTTNEKKQWQAMQQELASLKQQQVTEQIRNNYKQQDEQLKAKFANYNPEAVDILTNDLLAGKVQATREHIFKALDYEAMADRAYKMGLQDALLEKQDKLNASAYTGLTTGKPATDVPVAEKNESSQSFFRRIVANNIAKQKIQR